MTPTATLTVLALDAARLAGALSELERPRPEVPVSRLLEINDYRGGVDGWEVEAVAAS